MCLVSGDLEVSEWYAAGYLPSSGLSFLCFPPFDLYDLTAASSISLQLSRGISDVENLGILNPTWEYTAWKGANLVGE